MIYVYMSETSVIFKSLQRFGLAGVYTTSKNSLPRRAGHVVCFNGRGFPGFPPNSHNQC